MLTVNWNRYHYYQKNFEGARGRLCSSKGAPVPWHNGTMASPSLPDPRPLSLTPVLTLTLLQVRCAIDQILRNSSMLRNW